MRDSDRELAERLKSMDLEALREEHQRVFGQPGRGGAEYLRKRIAFGLLQAEEQKDRVRAAEEPTMASGKTDQLVEHALEMEEDRQWVAAEEAWREAAERLGTPQRKEYLERAKRCWEAAQVKAPEQPEAGPHLEHLEAANEAERDGNLKGAIVEWELAAGKARSPLRETFLARAEQLRALLPKMTPEEKRRAEPSNVKLEGRRLTVGEIEDMQAGRPTAPPVNKPAPPVNDPPPIVNKPPLKPAASIAEPKQEARAGAPRDPRLPPADNRLRRSLPSGGFVDVKFSEGAGVLLVQADPEHLPLVGQTFSSVSGLARAYCGRNTNGYQWLGLKEPWVATKAPPAAEQPKRPGAPLHPAVLEAAGVIVPKPDRAPEPEDLTQDELTGTTLAEAVSKYAAGQDRAQQAITITVRRCANLLAELAEILELGGV